jgi:hypothetical protein
MEQRLRKERAISRRRIGGPEKNPLASENAVPAQSQGKRREHRHDKNVTEAIKWRSACV